MTFAEKARKEHPERFAFDLGYPPRDCPHHAPFDYPDTREDCHCAKYTCRQCWNREIPEEPVEEPKPKTIKKTKAELLKEIDELNIEVERLNEEAKRLEKYAQYEEVANEAYAIYEAFKKSGFEDDKAFDIVKDLVVNGF